MADVALGLGSVFCGCQANVFLLELIIKGSPGTFYALTFAQYVCVAALTLPMLMRLKTPEEDVEGAVSMWPFRWRRGRIPLRNKLILAAVAWAMSVANNIVFSFDVSVPLHATFRSSSLMVNMLVGYLFLQRRFSLPQVLCATTICAGLVALTLEKQRKAQRGADAASVASLLSAQPPSWHGAVGVFILVSTTFCTAGLGVFQEYMYTDARQREAGRKADGKDDDVAPMWAEALCTSHVYALPLFLLFPTRLVSEFAAVQPGSQWHIVWNCLTQLVCIAGVYLMNHRTSAFTLTLTLTLRKLATVTLSVFYFGHYRSFTPVEWVAMVGALAAGAAYPFLRKPQAGSEAAKEVAVAAAMPVRRRARSSSTARKKNA